MKSKLEIFSFNLIILLLFCFIFVMSSNICYAFSVGGGGIFSGANFPSNMLPIIELKKLQNTINFSYIGGFGVAIFENSIYSENKGIAGGFGGVIWGYQLFEGNIVDLNILYWFGFGGIGLKNSNYYPYITNVKGYFSILNELTVDLGIKPNMFFEIFSYAGFQVITNMIPGPLFQGFTNYSFTYGIRIAGGI